MKVIDLLNKMANNEEVPKRIKVFGNEFEFLYQSGDNTYFDNNGDYLFSDVYDWERNLNEEIEIIEEKPISLKPFKDYLEDTMDLPHIDKDIRVIEYIHQLSLKVNYLLEKESDK